MKSPSTVRERPSAVARALRKRRPTPRPIARSSGPVAIDPRLDARRRSVHRSLSRRRRVLLIVAAAVATLGALVWPLTHSALLSATALEVTGNTHTSAEAVLQAAGISTHPPMIDVNTTAAAQAVEALPWVASARVELHWPDGAVVQVTERQVAAAAAEGSGWAELDQTGRVLAVVPSLPSGVIQLVSVGSPGAPGTTLRDGRAALKVAAALPVAIRSLVVAVAPAPGNGVDVALSDGVGVVFGTATQLPSKFEDIASLVAGAHLVSGSLMDVTVPESPAVTPPSPAGSTNPAG